MFRCMLLYHLSMARICKDDSWNNASNNWMRIHDIIQFAKEFYDVNYAENSRETFRKQALHHFRIAAVVEDNGKSTNSPLYSYRLTNEFLHLVKQLSSNEYISTLQKFNSEHEKLKDIYESKKKYNCKRSLLMEKNLIYLQVNTTFFKKEFLKTLLHVLHPILNAFI